MRAKIDRIRIIIESENELKKSNFDHFVGFDRWIAYLICVFGKLLTHKSYKSPLVLIEVQFLSNEIQHVYFCKKWVIIWVAWLPLFVKNQICPEPRVLFPVFINAQYFLGSDLKNKIKKNLTSMMTTWTRAHFLYYF